MLYVFTGGDSVATRAKAHEFLDAYEEKGMRAERLSAETCSMEILKDRIGAQSLFSTEKTVEIFLLDTPSEKSGMLDSVLELAPALAESSNIFIVLEQKLLAGPSKILKAHAAKYVEVKGAEAQERFNIFSLSDAFARRDKKSLWVLLMQAQHAGMSSEEIAGTLLWQVKSMRLAANSRSAEESGLKPFVFTKAKRAAEKFKRGELDELSRSLITLYHEARLGKVDMDISLERWVLTI